jgi:DNA repair exonuclease SbcCD nuclease subunit
MKIIHVSDTHIGFSAYRKVDQETGINQREMDIYRRFAEFADKAIEIHPDVVIHSGDLFDSVRPSNRAISVALDNLARITEAGIPVVVIAGNHSTPRLRETGSVFKILEHVRGLKAVYSGVYERMVQGDLTIHAVPHNEGDALFEQLSKVCPDGDAVYNVETLHAGVSGLSVFKMGEFNETIVPSSYLRTDMDYIALGHYHNFSSAASNAFYAGSIERLTFAEANESKGFIVVDLDTKKREFIRLAAREMLDLGPIDASGMNAASLTDEISNVLETVSMEGRIVRLIVNRVPSALYKSLDFNRIVQRAALATHFEPKFEVVQENSSVQWKNASIDSIESEYSAFLDQYPVERVSKDEVRAKGLEYLKRGLEGSS